MSRRTRRKRNKARKRQFQLRSGTYKRWNMLRRLSEAQNHRCCYCGCRCKLIAPGQNKQSAVKRFPTMATIEHVVPLTYDGAKWSWKNLAMACALCNNRRQHYIEPDLVRLLIELFGRAFVGTIPSGVVGRHRKKEPPTNPIAYQLEIFQPFSQTYYGETVSE